MGSLQSDIKSIIADKQHGSSIILHKIIQLLGANNYNIDELRWVFNNLRKVDEAMIIIHHFLDLLEPKIGKDFYYHLDEYIGKWANVEEVIAENLYHYIKSYKAIKILAHSQSGVVLKTIETLVKNNINVTVYQTESLPGGEGYIQAHLLKDRSIPVSLIKDHDIEEIIGDINCCLLGVDQYDNGGFVNKVGSSEIAELASINNVPVYVLGDTRKEVSSCNVSNHELFEYTELNESTLLITQEDIDHE
ncbi:MAG: hypothetical protein ABFS32_09630 [Bacteroidota bacterium]